MKYEACPIISYINTTSKRTHKLVDIRRRVRSVGLLEDDKNVHMRQTPLLKLDHVQAGRHADVRMRQTPLLKLDHVQAGWHAYFAACMVCQS